MKSIKKLLSILFVSISSFVLVGVMNVSAQVGFANGTPVCTPDNVKPGEEVTCYLTGTGTHTTASNDGGSDGQDVEGKTHGFVTRLYTTDGLMFDRVEPYITGTSATALEATAQSDSGKQEITISDQTKIEFTCTYKGDLAAPKAEWQIEQGDDYRCALFYSNTKTPAVTVSLAAPPDDIKDKTGTGNGIMVIGKVITHISDDVDAGSSCGELCVFTKEAKDTSSYKDGLEGSDAYVCTEVHYTKDGTPASNVETGAFTSYLLLAAGAVVAIGAVVLAKKNNKFYKV